MTTTNGEKVRQVTRKFRDVSFEAAQVDCEYFTAMLNGHNPAEVTQAIGTEIKKNCSTAELYAYMRTAEKEKRPICAKVFLLKNYYQEMVANGSFDGKSLVQKIKETLGSESILKGDLALLLGINELEVLELLENLSSDGLVKKNGTTFFITD